MGTHDQPDLFSQSLNARCYGNRFWRESAATDRDRNSDARINTADDPTTSDKNLVTCGPVTAQFCKYVCA